MRMISNIFRRLVHPSIEGGGGGGSVRLSIEGIAPAPLTPEPDDAELAAAALLENLVAPARMDNGKLKMDNSKRKNNSQLRKGSPAYYRQLAEKIKTAHVAEARAAMRFVAYCEQEIQSNQNTQSARLTELEQGLFKHQDTVEREGGDLLRRWQHCLADVTVRQMQKYQLSTQ